jgi:isoquinoline 1-oxidoreductase beta subunit
VIRAGDEAVAVIADHMWAAKQGLEALNVVWEPGPNGGVTISSLVTSMDRASQRQGVIAAQRGDAAGAINGAATKLSAIYQLPFLSHSPMEPLNCTLHIQPDRAEIWVGTQVPVRAQKAVMAATGLPPEKVTVNNQLIGGAFGRRLDVDSIELAAAIAKQVDYPVKLIWTREEDLRHDYYRPYYYDRVAAGLDSGGKLVGRTHRVTGPSIYARLGSGCFQERARHRRATNWCSCRPARDARNPRIRRAHRMASRPHIPPHRRPSSSCRLDRRRRRPAPDCRPVPL